MAQQTFNDGELRSSIRSKLNQNATEAQAHITATDNPHAVTAAQVGLGNVDNTADVDKPVSTATQNALNLKADQSGLGTAAPLDVPASGDAAAGEVVKGDDSRLSDARTPTTHTHDDRYYTESEVDGFLSGKLSNLSDDTTPTLGGTLDGGGNEIWNFKNRIVTEAGTAVTLGATHYGTVVNFTSATAVAVTVPDTIPAGVTIGWVQSGAGALTFTGSGTMVVNNVDAETSSSGQYAQGSLFVVSSTSAILTGATAQ